MVSVSDAVPATERRRSERVVPAALSLAVVLAGALRFYGLAWGAPYFHFHIDEHFVFSSAYSSTAKEGI